MVKIQPTPLSKPQELFLPAILRPLLRPHISCVREKPRGNNRASVMSEATCHLQFLWLLTFSRKLAESCLLPDL